jgi:DNA-binding MarR family transcriptional regulator
MHRPSRDRRRQVWCTTQAGFALLDGLAPQLEDLAAGIDAGLSGPEQQTFVALCNRVAEGGPARGPQAAPSHDAQLSSEEAA